MQDTILILFARVQDLSGHIDLQSPASIAAMISFSVFLLVTLVFAAIAARSGISRRTAAMTAEFATAGAADNDRRALSYGDRKRINSIIQRAGALITPKNDREISNIRLQLVKAGFLSPYAVTIYFGIRVLLAIGLPLLLIFITSMPGLRLPAHFSLLAAGAAAVVGLIVPGVVLDWLRARARDNYRLAFPDLMDLLVVCVEAGHSLPAALERIGREIAATNRLLSANIHMLNLELRAGRDLSTALRALSERLGIEEVRSLALLMRQSEELGTSLANTLRVFSDEMRDKRLMRAEARANALPVKLVIPLGLFIFPVILLVIMTPLVIRISRAFG
jgi:tight adherence protein C